MPHRPCSIDGPSLSIRTFARNPLTFERLIEVGALTPPSVRFLKCRVQARMNVLIPGGTGSGKTTMLNAPSSCIGENERIVTIEDAAELQLQQEHVVRLETRPGADDARFLSVSIAIQHGTGGDLARVIRDRLMMRRKIKAISAEGRLSAVILSMIPLIIIAVMPILVPSSYGDISGAPLFRPTAIVVMGLVVANALVMRGFVNFGF